MWRWRLKSIILLFSMSTLSFCNNESESKVEESVGEAILEIRLAGAVARCSELNIDIQSISINQSKSENSGWVELEMKKPAVCNITKFRNGVDTLLMYCTVNAGQLCQIKIGLGSGNTVVAGGISNKLAFAESSPGTVWIKLDEELIQNKVNHLYIDFNVYMPPVKNSRESNCHLDPVIRVYGQDKGGTIAGKVIPEEAKAIVWAVLEGDSLFAIPEQNGRFQISGLKASEKWTIKFKATKETGYSDMVYNYIPITDRGATIFDSVILRGESIGSKNQDPLYSQKCLLQSAGSYENDE